MSEGAGIRDGAGRPRRLVDLIGTFLWSPLDPATWRANLAILLGLLIAMLSVGTLSACFSAGGSMLIWLIGIPIIGLGIEFSRLFARVERWRMTLVDRRPLLPHSYRPFDGPPRRPFGPWVRAWAETEFLDANRWRDVVYILVLAPLAALEFALAVGLWAMAVGLVLAPLVLAGLRSIGVGPLLADVPVAWDTAVIIAMFVGLALVPVAASTSRGLMLMHRAVVEGLLCVSPSAALRQEVARLRGSRSAAVELEASELRRIERDLHDGAQQRLVMLSIDLGLAADRMEKDPAVGARARRGGPGPGPPGARRAARPRARDRAGDPARPRPGRGAGRDRGALPGADGRPEHAAGRHAAPGRDGAHGLLRGGRGAGQRRQARVRRALRDPLPGGGPRSRGGGLGRRRRRRADRSRAAGWRGWRVAWRRSTGRWRSRAQPGGPTLVRAVIPPTAYAPR